MSRLCGLLIVFILISFSFMQLLETGLFIKVERDKVRFKFNSELKSQYRKIIAPDKGDIQVNMGIGIISLTDSIEYCK